MKSDATYSDSTTMGTKIICAHRCGTFDELVKNQRLQQKRSFETISKKKMLEETIKTLLSHTIV